MQSAVETPYFEGDFSPIAIVLGCAASSWVINGMGVRACSQDVLKDAVESNMQSAVEMPYFEGDFWPNILEESIKELEEEEDKRRREEMEAASSAAADVEELATEKEDSGEVYACYY